MIAALLDINFVLDFFLARLPWVPDSAAVLAANQRGELVGHLSAASIPTISLVVRRNADLAKALGGSYRMPGLVRHLAGKGMRQSIKIKESGKVNVLSFSLLDRV